MRRWCAATCLRSVLGLAAIVAPANVAPARATEETTTLTRIGGPDPSTRHRQTAAVEDGSQNRRSSAPAHAEDGRRQTPRLAAAVIDGTRAAASTDVHVDTVVGRLPRLPLTIRTTTEEGEAG